MHFTLLNYLSIFMVNLTYKKQTHLFLYYTKYLGRKLA